MLVSDDVAVVAAAAGSGEAWWLHPLSVEDLQYSGRAQKEEKERLVGKMYCFLHHWLKRHEECCRIKTCETVVGAGCVGTVVGVVVGAVVESL